jgi:phytoene dehydrogenase-like protein
VADVRAKAKESRYDAIVVGAGPNGLAAAIVFAKRGHSVLLVEGHDTIGGGARTAERTLAGFRSDVCSAIHPTALASPYFRSLDLEAHGVEWVHPDVPLAHPFDDGGVAMLERSFDAMHAGLGDDDARAWRDLYAPLLDGDLFVDLLAPIRVPRHPISFVRFGLNAMRDACELARATFDGPRARALFGGCAAHSILPLEAPFSAAFGIVIALAAHAYGWPCARGGSQSIVDALATILRENKGEIIVGTRVESLDDLPDSRVVLFDTSPRALARISGDALPDSFRRRLERFRHGPAVFKIDWALDGPIPWRARACHRAGTVHVGGTLDEVAASERAPWRDEIAERPFVLVAQQSLFDATRAPEGKHVGWGYCHVPNGCSVDFTERIESQIERFAPGFRDRILSRATISPAQLERYDPNCIGGDIAGGANDALQLFTRPVVSAVPYATPNERLYLASASTPPGGGVHGMCGWFAARAALRRTFGERIELE